MCWCAAFPNKAACGLRAVDERYFQVLYGPVPLGYLGSFGHVFHRMLSPAVRHRLGLKH